jgi:succinyl-CoA synthetase alpha subunit
MMASNIPEYELFNKDTKAIVFNVQTAAIQRMLDFDFACRRETPSVAAIVNPGGAGLHKCFFGKKEIILPIYRTTKEAVKKHPDADVFINFASFRSAYKTSLEALEEPSIRTVAIIAEGIPERRTRELIAAARKNNKWIIGPATVGGMKPGSFKIGNTAGPIENILDTNLHIPGFVGFVSKSGGMSNEMYNMIALACGPKNDEGKAYPALYEGISIGGDKYPGSTLLEHLLRYEANPAIKMLVMLGEVGGEDEYEIVDALKSGKIKKPLVAWVTGTCARLFPGEVQFGHAGAKAGAEKESADAKNKALREAGAIVPASYDELAEKTHEVYMDLLKKGVIKEIPIPERIRIPMDLSAAEKAGLVRRPTNFICTISDDRGEEATYQGVEISSVVNRGMGIGGAIGLLWFKKELPKFASDFIEMVLVITADHGPAVSGAHNAIVASRAGKDLISSLASGLLTIGPRFGGAIDDAARYFKVAYDSGQAPADFVKSMKEKGKNIAGIGHRIKSVQNPDKRVEIIKNYAHTHFKSTKYLDYALEVEKITTSKKNNLILNVDGCIGIVFLDMMESTGIFTAEEVNEIVELGFLNGLFVIGRSIGIIGHVMDQKRLAQPLYRHPWEDIAYIK